MTQQTLDFTPRLKPSEQEVVEALRVLIVASDTTDIQKALAEHGIPREKSTLAKRCCELEEKGLVARAGKSKAGKWLWRLVG